MKRKERKRKRWKSEIKPKMMTMSRGRRRPVWFREVGLETVGAGGRSVSRDRIVVGCVGRQPWASGHTLTEHASASS